MKHKFYSAFICFLLQFSIVTAFLRSASNQVIMEQPVIVQKLSYSHVQNIPSRSSINNNFDNGYRTARILPYNPQATTSIWEKPEIKGNNNIFSETHQVSNSNNIQFSNQKFPQNKKESINEEFNQIKEFLGRVKESQKISKDDYTEFQQVKIKISSFIEKVADYFN